MLKLIRRIELPAVPSASGIEKVGDFYWLIGDNSPFVYRCDEKFGAFQRFPIFEVEVLKNGVVPKKKKRDVEAMFSYVIEEKTQIFVLGSGSKKNRMQAVYFAVDAPEKINKFNLEPLYHSLMEVSGLTKDELNIEAATVVGESLFLFNRKKNLVFALLMHEFICYVENSNRLPSFEVKKFELPSLDGFEAGFSGAATDHEHNRILFTASVEQTDSTYLDGETSGSYVGLITLEDFNNEKISYCKLLKTNEKAIKVKVESITLEKSEGKVLNCLLVTDSDGGISELLEVELQF